MIDKVLRFVSPWLTSRQTHRYDFDQLRWIAWRPELKTNKYAQSTLGRGPRRCESKSPLVTMARSKFAPKSTRSRGPIAKPHHLPHPWTRPTLYDAKRHPDPIRLFSTMHWTDRQTDRPTDHSRGKAAFRGECCRQLLYCWRLVMCMHDMQTAVGIPVVTIVHIFVWLPPGLHLYPATTLTLPSPLSLDSAHRQ